MRYNIADIEDQIIATLTRQTLTGTISSSGTAITGVTTDFVTDLTVGDQIVAPSDETGAEALTVATITDTTHMTVTSAPSSALSGKKFAKRFPDGEVFECETCTGDLDTSMFMFPQFMEGLIRRAPFILVQYQGRSTKGGDRDAKASLYIHTLTFRLYAGANNLRSSLEARRGVYDLLANIYDRLHGRVPLMSSGQKLSTLSLMEGVPITTSEFNPLSALLETGGPDERLVVNLPEVKVYSTDFLIRLVA